MALLTIENNALRLDGQPFYLASGDFHYFRCLPGGWQRRLRLMKAFGLNTVQTYVPWNLHEPEKGRFCFDGHLNLKAFLALCQQEELYVLLRPSPYICSECDFGGLPAWLLREPDTCVRTCDERYLAHLEDYNRRLCREFVPMLSTHGGPILAVALENEYGSFGNDLAYLEQLKAQYERFGVDVPFYTADGPDLYKQTFGGFPSIWSGLDLRDHVEDAIAQWRRFQTGFPPLISEMWGGCAQQWGGVLPRQKPETVAEHYREALQTGACVNFYMFCGGTSFGFFSGALHAVYRADVPGPKDRYLPFTTSYDTDALVSEAGNATEKYRQCRKVLADYRGIPESSLPPIPADAPVQVPGPIDWQAAVPVFSRLDTLTSRRAVSGNFRTMESMGQSYGWILYTTHLLRTDPDSVFCLHLRGLHDRADLYLDGQYRGTYYRDRPDPRITFQITGPSVRIDLLVENMGRIGYGAPMLTDRKGILEFAQLDVRNPDGTMMYSKGLITGWENRSLPMHYPAVDAALRTGTPPVPDGKPQPRLLRGTFSAVPGVDTFLNFRVPGAAKGCVWINGFHLGRYWAVGPQDTLYVPGELLRESNTIDVLELYSDGAAPAFRFQDHAELDSISENAELILAPRA